MLAARRQTRSIARLRVMSFKPNFSKRVRSSSKTSLRIGPLRFEPITNVVGVADHGRLRRLGPLLYAKPIYPQVKHINARTRWRAVEKSRLLAVFPNGRKLTNCPSVTELPLGAIVRIRTQIRSVGDAVLQKLNPTIRWSIVSKNPANISI